VSIFDSTPVIVTALWPQGDIRDPLGVWGFRLGITGDASGGSVRMVATESTGQKGAYIYTCYSLLPALVTQASPNDTFCKARLLTNWPNVDSQAGVQAYNAIITSVTRTSTAATTPIGGPNPPLITSPDRFLLLFDPRQSGILRDIIELELAANVLNDVYSFEGYGYYWDRSVLNAPGGLRHPGSN